MTQGYEPLWTHKMDVSTLKAARTVKSGKTFWNVDKKRNVKSLHNITLFGRCHVVFQSQS